jgi:transcriptional regulator with XRE-family HTH domain
MQGEVAVNLNNMEGLAELHAAAGIDPNAPEYQLRKALARADSSLLNDLVRMRKDKGLTQQIVAERMNRDKSAVSNFERLGIDPHLSTIRRYAAAIGAAVTHQVKDVQGVGQVAFEDTITEIFDQSLDVIALQIRPDGDLQTNVVSLESHRVRRLRRPGQTEATPTDLNYQVHA